LLLAFAGCTGSGATGSLHVHCADGASFCVVSCDLGCGTLGCAITEVAENQRLRFTFNQAIDASSVTGSSFSILTPQGVAPLGNSIISGNSIVFVPDITVVNGVGTFGFQRNESYIVSIAGGSSPGQLVRSVSGSQLARDLTCTIQATRGIIDEDNAPPMGELIGPTNLAAAPVDATIIVRFSEVVDTTPFLTAIGPSTPIQYTLRRSRLDPISGDRVCDPSTAPIQIEGVPSVRLEQHNGKNVSVIRVKPSFELPGESCIEVRVTGDVRDLSGRAAVPSLHVFFTEASQVGDLNFDETFQDESRLDQNISGGTWNNGARPAQLGGDGRHGTFAIELGDPVGLNTYEWDTSSFTIPATNTFNGQAQVVTNGQFFFTDMTLAANETLRFVGPIPPQIFVRGRTEIHGTIDVSGFDIGPFPATQSTNTNPIPGQQGSLGGPGGGRGGLGGDRCLGVGPTSSGGLILEDGRDGESVQVLAGHAYSSQVTATGGAGSALHPTAGLTSALTYTLSFVFNGDINTGGGGGGFNGPGTGSHVVTPPPTTNPGNPVSGGQSFDLLPFPASPPPNYSSLIHYTVGGSGGGGGGSHPFAALSSSIGKWKAGGGGSGGGGSFVLRGGSHVVMSSSASLIAKGGSGYQINGDNPNTPVVELVTQPTSWGVCAPGGGGSGGTFLLQASRDLVFNGLIDTSGGSGCFTGSISPPTLNVASQAGDGAIGFYRLEAAGTISVTGGNAFVPAYVAANNQGVLIDRDEASGQVSLWRGTGLVFPPDWERYELEVDIDGDGIVDVTFTDEVPLPAGAMGPALDPLGPVTIKFQGARLNSTTNEPLENTAGPWRDYINENAGQSLNSDAVTAFRFQILFNTRDYPDAVVKRLLVVARG